MRSYRLGKVLGFEIRVDLSWFLIFFLILWTLSVGVFPARLPGLATEVYLVMGACGSILFFASLVAHELAHSIVARARGIEIEGITLFLFGGMARMRDEAKRPGDEFVIAAVGPLMSLAIATMFGAISGVAEQMGWHPAVSALTGYLAILNVVLAVFNLLPGFPLDGGRLFRAIVWHRTGDVHKATRWAATGGRLIGFGLTLIGFLEMFAGLVMAGLWMLLIGWFLRMAADEGLKQHVLRGSMEGVKARDLMTAEPHTVSAAATVQSFVDDEILDGRHRAYPVVDDGHVLGLITLDRIRTIPRNDWQRRSVGDVMIPADENLTVSAEDAMDRVLSKLQARGRVLVTSDGTISGIITGTDIARWLERAELIGSLEGRKS